MADPIQAKRFLEALGIAGSSKLCFRTFSDSCGHSAKNHFGTLEEVWATLSLENARGNGVFLVINEGGHSKAAITRVRAVFADNDTPDKHWMTCVDPRMLPHAIVETSPGKWHAYWKVADLPIAEFSAFQKSIADRFATDSSVTDLSRVMRLPGFMHQKGNPFLVKMPFWRDKDSTPYTPDDLRTAWNASPALAPAPAPAPAPGPITAGNRNRSLTSIAGRLRRQGKSMEEIASHLRATPTDPPLPAAEIDRIAASVARYAPGNAANAEFVAPQEILCHVALDNLMEAEAAAPQFVVFPIIPRDHVTLIGGHGGAGKSNLALTIAAHAASGTAWAGFNVAKGRCLFVSLEDPGELVRYRLRKIVEAFGLCPRIVEGSLSVLDGSGTGCALMTERSEFGTRSLVPLPSLVQIADVARGMDLVVIDNASDAFDGDENNRRQVRQFIRALAAIARSNGSAVVLLAHIDKHAARNGAAGNSYSGSTAWHNSVRSRLALLANEESGVELRHEKSNLSRSCEPTLMRWSENGVLLPVSSADSMRAAANAEAEDAARLFSILGVAGSVGTVVPTAEHGPRTAYEALESFAELGRHFGTGRAAKRRVRAALCRLHLEGKIYKHSYRNIQRRIAERWLVTDSSTSVVTAAASPREHP